MKANPFNHLPTKDTTITGQTFLEIIFLTLKEEFYQVSSIVTNKIQSDFMTIAEQKTKMLGSMTTTNEDIEVNG